MTPFNRLFGKVREINKKYATPTIRMSAMTRVVLLCLRLYLVFLVLLLLYKFITMLKG